jgi:catechol 2,3-dioxygenase-like lactoylglutathione lyase family enzyme
MNWKINQISIPVFDLDVSKKFYQFLLCNDFDDKQKKSQDTSDECFIFGGDIDLKLYKLKTDSIESSILQSRRTYPTIALQGFDVLKNTLIEEGISYLDNKKKNSITIQEPGLNYIELTDLKTDIKSHKIDKKSKWNFHHINLECYDVRASVNFIKKYFKIQEGSWKAPVELGKVNISTNQLAIFNLNDNHSGIHINKADFTFSWRNKFLHNPTIGGHPAFSVRDIGFLLENLKKNNVPYTDAKVYAMPNIHQVYLYDPNANIIEINQNIQ